MLVVKLNLNVLDLILAQTGCLQSGRESRVLADVGLCACLALGLDVVQLGVFADEVELIDGQTCELLKGVGLAVFDYLLDEGCLAYGDAVLVSELYELVVGVGHILA